MAALRVGRFALNALERRLLSPAVCVAVRNPASSARFLHLTSQCSAERKFTKDHEWISVADQVGTVGISDHAQNLLGDAVFIELPDVGTELAENDIFGVIESVKAASDLYAPVSGEVVETNSDLTENPSMVNEDPYGNGWMLKIKLSNPLELDALMDEAAYVNFVAESEPEE